MDYLAGNVQLVIAIFELYYYKVALILINLIYKFCSRANKSTSL